MDAQIRLLLTRVALQRSATQSLIAGLKKDCPKRVVEAERVSEGLRRIIEDPKLK